MGDHRLLGDFSIEELEKEIVRRKNKRPNPLSLEKRDWHNVVSYVDYAMRSLEDGVGLPKDFEQHLMERVIDTLYPPSVWTWWNARV